MKMNQSVLLASPTWFEGTTDDFSATPVGLPGSKPTGKSVYAWVSLTVNHCSPTSAASSNASRISRAFGWKLYWQVAMAGGNCFPMFVFWTETLVFSSRTSVESDLQ
ncbi:MAG TPA: hypothetical protein PK012_19895 [Blastocatellia bacterium]|nr:hypothetical protein [Blastocatellia bacterium]